METLRDERTMVRRSTLTGPPSTLRSVAGSTNVALIVSVTVSGEASRRVNGNTSGMSGKE